MHKLGHTRSANQRDHLLHTPDTFVRTPLPGMRTRHRHRPHLARSRRSLHPVHRRARTRRHPRAHSGQRFVYVLEGAADLATDTTFHTLDRRQLSPTFPQDAAHTLTAHSDPRSPSSRSPTQPLADPRLRPSYSSATKQRSPSVPLNGRPRPPGAQPAARLSRLRLRRQHHDLPARRRRSAWSRSTSWSTAC